MTGWEQAREFFLGAIAMGDFLACLFFFRFWKMTADRFFLYFAASFGFEMICRFFLIQTTVNSESEPLVYGLRLLSYAAILLGILDKNRVGITKMLFHRT